MNTRLRQLYALCVISLVAFPVSSEDEAHWLYSVRPGDTLWSLCQQHTIKPNCWRELAVYNNVEYPKTMPMGTIVRFPVSWLRQVPRPVKIGFVIGAVRVSSAPTKKPVDAKLGMLLPIGSTIYTERGTVSLEFADGSILTVEANSVLRLDTLSAFTEGGMVDSTLRLPLGSVTAKVVERKPRSRFRIITPSAVAAVRGTEYRVTAVDSEQAKMRSEVYEGSIDVSLEVKRQQVPHGFGIVAAKDQPLTPPKKLLPAPVFDNFRSTQSLPVEIDWQSLAGAQNYYLEILTVEKNDQLIETFRNSETRQVVEALDIGCYRVRLRGVDRDELLGLIAEQKLCVENKLSPVSLGSRAIKRIKDDKLRVSWSGIEDASAYRVEVAKDAEFEQVVLKQDVTDTQFLFDLEEKREALFFRVQALADGRESDFSRSQRWRPANEPLIFSGVTLLMLLVTLI